MAKISLSNIAEELAVKGALTREAADGFVRAFVETIERGLQKEGIVKVKGLGTFKLQEVNDRDSVDVNTGERITIKGYRKVTFTPDSAMKELVNRPFAHFEPTELNEGFPTDEEPVESDNVVDEGTEIEAAEEVVEVVAEEPTIEEPVAEEQVDAEPVADEPVTDEPVAEEPVAEEPATVVEEPVAEEPITEETVSEESAPEEAMPEAVVADAPVAEEVPVAPIQKCKKRRRGGCLWGLLLLLVAALALVYGYFTLGETAYNEPVEDSNAITIKSNLEEELGAEWGDEPKAKALTPAVKSVAEVREVPVATSEPKPDTAIVAMPEPSVAQPAKPVAKVEDNAVVLTESLKAKSIKDITPADTTDYVMGETLVEHKLKKGETIIQLSNKYYGDKRLWPYIVKHNHITDFNKVAIGMKINIPSLQPKE